MRGSLRLVGLVVLLGACSSQSAGDADPAQQPGYVDTDQDGLPDTRLRAGEEGGKGAFLDADGDGLPDRKKR